MGASRKFSKFGKRVGVHIRSKCVELLTPMRVFAQSVTNASVDGNRIQQRAFQFGLEAC